MTRQTPSFLRQAFSTFATQVVLVLLGLVAGIIVSRTLGPAGRGSYALLSMIPAMAFRFGNLGLGSAATYWMNRGTVPHRRLVSTLFFAGLALSALSVTIILAVRPGNVSVYADISPRLILLAACATPAVFLNTYAGRVLLGWKLIEKMNLFRALQAVIFLALVVLLLVVLGGGVWEALLAFVISNVVVMLMLMVAVLRRSGWSPQVDVGFLRQAVAYGFPAFLLMLFNYLNHYSDVFLVKHFLNNTQVGLYTLAISWVERFLYVPMALGTVLFPRIAEDAAGQNRDLVTRSGRHGLALVLVAMALFAVVAKPVIRGLYGEDFAGSIPAIYALMPGVVLFTLYQVYLVCIAADGHPWVVARASMVGFALKLGLSVFWIPRQGIVGAGLATSVCYASMAVMVLLIYRRLYGVGLREMTLLRPAEARQTLRRIASKLPSRFTARNP